MELITVDITYYRSTYFPFYVSVTPPTGMTATTALMTVKTTQNDEIADDSSALFKKSIPLTANVGQTSINNSDIDDTVDAGTYYYSIHVILSDGNPYPFANGKFILKVDTTNRVV
jgi:hypothetical protein